MKQSLSGKKKQEVINGNIKGLLFLIYDFVKTAIQAKRQGLSYATYRIFWFKTEKQRDEFKKKHKI